MKNATARTRKELLNALWGIGERAFNIAKEGPRYVVMVFREDGKAFLCATGIRQIDSLTIEDWARLLADKRWSISNVRPLPKVTSFSYAGLQ